MQYPTSVTSSTPESCWTRRDAVGDEVERVILDPEVVLLGARRIPVDHVDVVAAGEQELDQALARREVEDVGLVRRRHDEQDRHPVDLVGGRVVVIERSACRADAAVSCGVVPTLGGGEPRSSRPLRLRWIARSTSSRSRSASGGSAGSLGLSSPRPSISSCGRRVRPCADRRRRGRAAAVPRLGSTSPTSLGRRPTGAGRTRQRSPPPLAAAAADRA